MLTLALLVFVAVPADTDSRVLGSFHDADDVVDDELPPSRVITPVPADAVIDPVRVARLRRLKRAELASAADAARDDAIQANIEGLGLVAGACALPALSWTGLFGASAIAHDPVLGSGAGLAMTTFGVAGCVSTCIALPVGLIAGATRLSDAGTLGAEADARDDRLRAFDAGAMHW